jgi:predicted acetyltransferase
MPLVLVPAGKRHSAVLRRLVELYRYDFSELDGSDVGDGGEFGYRYLPAYESEPDRHPFLFQVDGRWAGFALVRAGPPHDMAEFFVMRKYRRRGIGREAAVQVFRRFPGKWTVRQRVYNPAATAFWRRVIPSSFEETVTDDEVIQHFEARP